MRASLTPLPKRAPHWSQWLAGVATVLDAWRRYASRASYPIDLVKVLHQARLLAVAIGQAPALDGCAVAVVGEIERWSLALLSIDGGRSGTIGGDG